MRPSWWCGTVLLLVGACCGGPMEIDAPDGPLAVGARWTPIVRQGDAIVENPRLSSSDPTVAGLDPATGALVALAPGSTTVSLEEGSGEPVVVEVAAPVNWEYGWGEPAAVLAGVTYSLEVRAVDDQGRPLMLNGLDPVTPGGCFTLFGSTQCHLEAEEYVELSGIPARRIPAVAGPDFVEFTLTPTPNGLLAVAVTGSVEEGALAWYPDTGEVVLPSNEACSVVKPDGGPALCHFTLEIDGNRTSPKAGRGGTACRFDGRDFLLETTPGVPCDLAVVFQLRTDGASVPIRYYTTTTRVLDGVLSGEGAVEFRADPGARVSSRPAAAPGAP